MNHEIITSFDQDTAGWSCQSWIGIQARPDIAKEARAFYRNQELTK